ncbi:MAG: YbjN domain-containing protein [Geminicoccaceae bacterium]
MSAIRMTAMQSLLALALSVMNAGPLAAEPLIDARDPIILRDIIARYGTAFLMIDIHGDPLIEGRIDGQQFRVHFHECVDGADCKMLGFRRSWVRPELTLEQINRWNNERLFGVATLDPEGTSTIGLDVNLDHGVTQANFTETVETWRLLLTEFAAYAEGPTG